MCFLITGRSYEESGISETECLLKNIARLPPLDIEEFVLCIGNTIFYFYKNCEFNHMTRTNQKLRKKFLLLKGFEYTDFPTTENQFEVLKQSGSVRDSRNQILCEDVDIKITENRCVDTLGEFNYIYIYIYI